MRGAVAADAQVYICVYLASVYSLASHITINLAKWRRRAVAGVDAQVDIVYLASAYYYIFSASIYLASAQVYIVYLASSYDYISSIRILLST